jgi:hypothetical protein
MTPDEKSLSNEGQKARGKAVADSGAVGLVSKP